jgi:hypothetical protein
MKSPMSTKRELAEKGIVCYNTSELEKEAKQCCYEKGKYLRTEVRFKPADGNIWLVVVYADKDDGQQCEANIAI